ncbi:MAG: AMP-binding protein [Oligoflexia bacterium]|nr:AMP-binding protein [Oligoflexia bacterium]
MKPYTSHLDTFTRDNLPPSIEWPVIKRQALPELEYPERLNCASELLDRSVAAGHASKPLIWFEQQVWSYADLLQYANRIANVLIERFGLVAGNRVLLRGPNNPLMAACWFGVVKAGGVVVTTMPLLRERELNYIVEKAQISFALCDRRFSDELVAVQQGSETLRDLLFFGGEGENSLERLAEAASPKFNNVETAADDTVLIAFTSGTTGKAKGCMHAHRDVMTICDCFPRSILKPVPEDRFIGTPPFAFTFGLGGLLLFPMRYGASTILLEKPGPGELLEAFERRGASICFTSPTMYKAMLEQLPKFKPASLKKCVSAGETLPASTFEAWERATGIRIIDGIGATELLHIFISASPEEMRPGMTGKAIPGYEAQVIDETGQPVPDGQVGLLAVRGPTGCRYLNDPDRQHDYVKFGWNITGDAYTRDAKGYFQFHSRADDMIISSGYNISGVEVESALLSHPAVKECGVVGVPDEERGHIVKAFVVLRDPAQRAPESIKMLQDFVKAEIAPYKYPREIEFVDALPRTETGKLQRFRLRE